MLLLLITKDVITMLHTCNYFNYMDFKKINNSDFINEWYKPKATILHFKSRILVLIIEKAGWDAYQCTNYK